METDEANSGLGHLFKLPTRGLAIPGATTVLGHPAYLPSYRGSMARWSPTGRSQHSTDFGPLGVQQARFNFALGCIQALQCDKNTCPTGITTHNPRLQKGLHPPTKAARVAAYAKNMIYEVGTIAHACGVRSPRELRRFHARVVQPNGITSALNELYPDVQIKRREPQEMCKESA